MADWSKAILAYAGAVIVILMVAALGMASAKAWDTRNLNAQIDETAFIVGTGCSGTLIDTERRLILTAHHCIEHKVHNVDRKERQPDGTVEEVEYERWERINVSQKRYRSFEQVGNVDFVAEIFAKNHERDIALLQVLSEDLGSRTAAPILPKGGKVLRGEVVWAVGNPLGLDATVSQGVVANVNRTFEVSWALDEKVPLIQHTAPAAPGSSGGPLYNAKGEVIGITIAGMSIGTIALAVPVFEVHDLLDRECLASLYDPKADDAKCEDEKEEKENEDDDEAKD